MDNQTRERMWAALVAGAAALLVGLATFITQLAGGELERRVLHLAWASLILGLALGSFMGFCFVIVGTQLLSRLGVTDYVAAAALIGILAVPLTPKIVKVVEKVLNLWIAGRTPT